MVLECVCCRVMSVDMLQECRARQLSVLSVMRGCLVGCLQRRYDMVDLYSGFTLMIYSD